MASNWFYADGQNQQQGPVEGAALASAFRSGAVTAQTLVWREGMPNWVPLVQVASQLGLIIVGAQAVQQQGAPAGNRIVKPASSSSAVWVIILVVGLFFFVAVFGILAAIALPAYQDYTVRAKVSEGVVMSSSVKLQVAEYYSANNRCPSNGEGDIQKAESYATAVIQAIHAAPGAGGCTVRIVFKNLGPSTTGGTEIVLTMDSQMHWAHSATMPQKYLPTSLRDGS